MSPSFVYSVQLFLHPTNRRSDFMAGFMKNLSFPHSSSYFAPMKVALIFMLHKARSWGYHLNQACSQALCTLVSVMPSLPGFTLHFRIQSFLNHRPQRKYLCEIKGSFFLIRANNLKFSHLLFLIRTNNPKLSKKLSLDLTPKLNTHSISLI